MYAAMSGFSFQSSLDLWLPREIAAYRTCVVDVRPVWSVRFRPMVQLSSYLQRSSRSV